MTSLRAWYQPGSWVSVSVPRRWLLVNVEPQHLSVQLLWEAVSCGDAAEDVLDILIASGVRATPSFVLLWLEETPRGIIRGEAALEVSAGGSKSTHTAEGHSLWVEVEVDPDSAEFILRGGVSGGGHTLPMASGVRMAGQVVITASLSANPHAVAAPNEQPGAGESGEKPIESTNSEQAAAAAEAAPTVMQSSSYDHLFGATVRPVPVDRVASRAGTPTQQGVEQAAGASGFGATAGWHTAAPSSDLDFSVSRDETATNDAFSKAPAVPTKPSVTPPPKVTPGGLIDAVPWLAHQSERREPLPPASADQPMNAVGASDSAPGEVEDAESTVNRAALLAGAARGVSGPTVLAGRCPAGHVTPPHSATCRVCRASISVQQPFQIARPPLGVLRLSTGDAVTLDRGVLIGRKPAAPPDAVERPHLIRVNSPEHDVSRQHAEIVLEGWHVYVRDLGSTNGTTVTLPGQPSQRLREGELQLLEHGAVIVLADEIQCVFEVTP